MGLRIGFGSLLADSKLILTRFTAQLRAVRAKYQREAFV